MSTIFKSKKQAKTSQEKETTTPLSSSSLGTTFLLPRVLGPELPLTEIAKRIARLPRHEPVLLIGPPGVGKTAILEQLAEEEAQKLGRVLIDLTELSPKQIEYDVLPELLKKPQEYYIYLYLPASRITEEFASVPDFASQRAESESVLWKFPSKIVPFLTEPYMKRIKEEKGVSELANIVRLIKQYREMRRESPELLQKLSQYLPLGMLFIDEATQGTRFFTESFMQHLTGERSWGEAKISPLVRLVLAANPPEFNIAASELPEPIFRRVRIYHVKPSIDEWWDYIRKKYRLKENIPQPVLDLLGFLMTNPQYFVPPQEIIRASTQRWLGYPNPATWEKVVALLLDVAEHPEWRDMLSDLYNLLGEEVYNALASYFMLKVPSAPQLLQNPSLFLTYREKAARGEIEGAQELAKGLQSQLLQEYVTNKMIASLAGYAIANMARAEELVPAYVNFFARIFRESPELGFDVFGKLVRMLVGGQIAKEEEATRRALFLSKVAEELFNVLKKEGIAEAYGLKTHYELLARALSGRKS